MGSEKRAVVATLLVSGHYVPCECSLRSRAAFTSGERGEWGKQITSEAPTNGKTNARWPSVAEA